MGIAASRSQAALLKQSENLLGKDDLEKLERSWERVSYGNRLDARGFQRALFGSFVMMMDWNQFLCGTAILLRGTHEARAALLFQVYDTKKLGYLSRSRLASFLTVIYDGDPNNGADAGGSIPNELATLYDVGEPEHCRRSGELEPDEFTARVRFDGKQLVTRWVDELCEHVLEGASPHVLALDRYYFPSLDVAGLAHRRGVDPQRVAALERIFVQALRDTASAANAPPPPPLSSSSLSSSSTTTTTTGADAPAPAAASSSVSSGPSGSSIYYTSAQWEAAAEAWIPRDLCGRVFAALSEAGRPGWTVCDFAEALTELAQISGVDGERKQSARGGLREGLKLLLGVFDVDKDGRLSYPEARAMVVSLAKHHTHRARQLQHPDAGAEDQEGACSDVFLDFSRLGYAEGTTAEEAALQVVGGSKDGFLEGVEGLGSWVLDAPGRGQLLRDLRLVACAKFGLKPSLPLHEWKIVLELIKQHQAKHLTTQRQKKGSSRSLEAKGPPPFKYGPAGTKWNLLPSTWWGAWKGFVQQTSGHGAGSPQAAGNRSARGGGRGSVSGPSGPGPIDNRPLLRRAGLSTQLLPNLSAGSEYEVVPPAVWKALSSWYSAAHPLERAVAAIRENGAANTAATQGGNGKQQQPQQQQQPLESSRLQLELYPLCLRATTCDNVGKPRPHMEREVVVSKAATVAELHAKVCAAFLVTTPREQSRLWNLASNLAPPFTSASALQQAGARGLGAAAAAMSAAGRGSGGSADGAAAAAAGVALNDDVLSPGDLTMGEANLRDGQLVVLEVALPDGSWPRSQLQADLLDRDNADQATGVAGDGADSGSSKGTVGNGLVGLHNLGNTCYMNASLQCLSHTPLLTQFFLNKAAWQHDLNMTNVMGHQGKLAHSYAHLITQMWSSTRRRALNPSAFKRALGRLSEQFAGDDQHDAQELLSFLLSGLSEDLNRIEHKPYIEQPDSDGTATDRELADTWWRNHLKRELSIVVALFTGQFKSLLTCQHCGYASARFEPFTFLQLPLPEETHRSITMILVPSAQGLAPIKYAVRVLKSGTLRDLVAALTALAAADPNETDEDKEEEGGGAPKEEGAAAAAAAGGAAGGASAPGSERSKAAGTSSCPRVLLAPHSDVALVDVQAHSVAGFIALDQPVAKVRENALLWAFELAPCAKPLAKLLAKPLAAVPPVGEHETKPSLALKASQVSQENGEKGGGAGMDVVRGDDHDDGRAAMEVEGPESSGAEDDEATASVPHAPPPRQPSLNEHSHKGGGGGGSKPPPPAPPPPAAGNGAHEQRPRSSALAEQALSFGYNRAGSGSMIVVAMHRSLARFEGFFQNPFRHHLLGTPLVLRIPIGTTARGLYRIIAQRVSRLLKAQARVCLREAVEESTQATRSPDNGADSRAAKKQQGGRPSGLSSLGPPVPSTEDPDVRWKETAISGQDANAGDIPQFGFRLREVTSDGMGDPKSHWLTRSVGRLIPYSEDGTDGDGGSGGGHGLADGACIAIDWHLAILKGWLDPTSPYCVLHPSASSASRGHSSGDRSLSLHKCLDTFSASESIKEAYCSKCKEHRNASLKTELWRLPPVLMVHLKRFQFTTYSRRKLHNLVKFPTEDLDMSKYVVREEGEGSEEDEEGGSNGERGETGAKKADTEDRAEDSAAGTPPVTRAAAEDKTGGSKEGDVGEEGLIGTSDGRGVEQYDLYAVVHHLGAMSAGHYVSSIKCRETGKWHCFNDNVLIPTTEKEVVSESAYILFYVRKDIAAIRNIEEVYSVGEEGGGGGGNAGGAGAEGPRGANGKSSDEDEVARMMKKRDRACTIM